jgi:hypothetical protein
MVIPKLGKLSTAQDLTAGATDSENVIQLPTTDYVHITDVWWVVDTETIATGDGSDTFQFQLVLAQEAALNNVKEVVSRTITGYADKALATAGRHIIAINVGKMLKDMLDTDGSDYEFIGMISTISAGATVSINAVLSHTEPQDESHRMTTVSNVGLPSSL